MGEAVEDRDARRFQRSLSRTASVESVIRMYGDPGHTAEVLRRYKEAALSRDTVPGTVIYDVDPVVFDDLIEIRTGGDKAVEALLERNDTPLAVSFWPLVTMSDNDVLAGWEDALRRAADRPHQVTVEVGSLLEQALTFEFGYVAFKRDTTRLRQMTSVLYLEELRERARRQDEARGRGRPTRLTMSEVSRQMADELRRVEQRGVGSFFNATSMRVAPVSTASGNYSLRIEPQEFVLQPESAVIQPERGYRMPDDLYRRIMDAPVETEIIPEVDDAELEVEDWTPWRTIYADDGNRVEVNLSGLDRAGYNPLADGYVSTGECNCDDCREVRVAARDEEDLEDGDWSEEYEEDDEE